MFIYCMFFFLEKFTVTIKKLLLINNLFILKGTQYVNFLLRIFVTRATLHDSLFKITHIYLVLVCWCNKPL